MDILIVRRKNNGWIAYFQSDEGQWEYGNSQAEAIGKLIITATANSTPIIGFYVEVRK